MQGKTPLFLARRNGHREVVAALEDAGPEVPAAKWRRTSAQALLAQPRSRGGVAANRNCGVSWMKIAKHADAHDLFMHELSYMEKAC